jgi:PAS domain S-box-containing protein
LPHLRDAAPGRGAVAPARSALDMTTADSPRGFWLPIALIAVPFVAALLIEGYEILAHAPILAQAREQVVHTFAVITTAEALDRAVQDAERGQRGYLLTGNPAYLEPYQTGALNAPSRLNELKQLSAGDAEQQRRWADLEAPLTTKLSELERALAARDREGIDAARRIVQTNVGLDAMQSISATIDAGIAAEKTHLADRVQQLADEEQRVSRAALLSGALAFGAMLIGAVLGVLALRSLLRAQAARGASDEQFRLLVDGVTDYAIYNLDPTGKITSWNRGAERLKGYSAEEALGSNFSRFWPVEEREAGAPSRALATALESGHFDAEGQRVRKDGSSFWASVNITPLRNAAGQHVGFAKITRDVSERRERERAHELTRRELVQAQKMDALGQLSGGIAHDFNNLLHVILNCVEILERRLSGIGPDGREYLEMVKRNASRAAGLTQRMLAFARRQPLEPRPVNPNQLIDDMADLLRRSLGESITLETTLGSRGWQISVDANQLEAAILNLAINARDAMPAGGRLGIETGNVFLDETYVTVHPDVSIGQYVTIAVSDTGVGMTAEVLAKAFDPFFTTKELGKGTGLGLSQVYGFITQSGGYVKMISEPGRGTVATLYLPRLLAASADEALAESVAAPSGKASESILVVEDDVDVRVFTAEVLKELGYHVLAVPDGRAALHTMEERSDIQLLFSDIGLPAGINGCQLSDLVRQRWPQVKILLTTGYAGNAMSFNGRADLPAELIAKPYTRSNLALKVRQVLDAN